MIVQRKGSGQGQTSHRSATVGQRPANSTEADRVLALLAKGFRRQHYVAIPTSRAATDHSNTAMLRMLQRHIGTRIRRIGIYRLSQAPPLQALQTTAPTHTKPD